MKQGRDQKFRGGGNPGHCPLFTYIFLVKQISLIRVKFFNFRDFFAAMISRTSFRSTPKSPWIDSTVSALSLQLPVKLDTWAYKQSHISP